MDVTRQNLQDIQAGLAPHLKELGEKLGLQLKWGRGVYGHGAYLKLEVAAIGDNGNPSTTESKNFELYCHMEGLEPEDLWGTFVDPATGGTFQIVGYNPRAPRMPLLCKDMANGKTYKFRAGLFQRSKAPITRQAPVGAAG